MVIKKFNFFSKAKIMLASYISDLKANFNGMIEVVIILCL